MTIDWQNIVALTIVAAAAIYLIRQAWTHLAGYRMSSGCMNCGGCTGGAGHGRDGTQFVPLSELSIKRRSDA